MSDEDAENLYKSSLDIKVLPSGRWLWVGGTPWIEKPENYPGAYNCSSTVIDSVEALGSLMNLAMMGCGTGAVIQPGFIMVGIPEVQRKISVTIEGEYRSRPGNPDTIVTKNDDHTNIIVGDSRQGWVDAYVTIIKSAIDNGWCSTVHIDLTQVRSKGVRLSGFGGVANPVQLAPMFLAVVRIINSATGRSLKTSEICLLIDEAAKCVVAGNVRRSAGIRQFLSEDFNASTLKQNLWKVGEDGKWSIDPHRDCLRMANHTRVFFKKPTLNEVIESVRLQHQSGEGAIQYAPEAIARCSPDVMGSEKRQGFFDACEFGGFIGGMVYLQSLGLSQVDAHERMLRYGLNPCAEIIGHDFFCNLSEVHLNNLDPNDFKAQFDAFRLAGIAAATLLTHKFEDPRYQASRERDPIVGVSFTGLFDFFVKAFGPDWLVWWMEGRPRTEQGDVYRKIEAIFLQRWRSAARQGVEEQCDRLGLKVPTRVTTVQPSGTKSLLSGASPGWHPPKALRYIRRITFGAGDPVAIACQSQGYVIVPGVSDKDDDGGLLDDPMDPRVTEWLVEIPVEVPWASTAPEGFDPNQLSAIAQFDFFMQVQRNYTDHNTSATIELREGEVVPLAEAIHTAISDGSGYISAALLSRFDDHESYPRLPFEPISEERYEALVSEAMQNKTMDFDEALKMADERSELIPVQIGPAPCDSEGCAIK